MADETSDGITKWGSHMVARYSSADPSKTIQQLNDGRADGVSISPWDGFSEATLDCIRGLDNVRIVVLHGLPDLPLDPLRDLLQLEELSTGETNSDLDLKCFPALKRLSTHWRKGLIQNASFSNVQSLHIWKYKSLKNDLSDFPEFPALQELELVQSTITSLHGISRHAELERLELHNLTKLERLGELHLPKLTSFFADACKKLSDHEQLGACQNLEELKLNECGTMKSVQFVNSLQELKTFRFMKTDVSDGDLSPLLRLADTYFTEKKHFSHKTGDMHQSRMSR